MAERDAQGISPRDGGDGTACQGRWPIVIGVWLFQRRHIADGAWGLDAAAETDTADFE